jgi:ribosomal 50S subunit-recycling heat shock protein
MMRLEKYLLAFRACQRRTVAHVILPQGRIDVNAVGELDVEKGMAGFGKNHFL